MLKKIFITKYMTKVRLCFYFVATAIVGKPKDKGSRFQDTTEMCLKGHIVNSYSAEKLQTKRRYLEISHYF